MLSHPVILAAGIVTPLLLLLGGWLLRSALIGIRRGETRFCAKCGYDLTGASTDRCSECGRDLNVPRAVVIGTRHVRRVRLALASFMLVCAIGIGTSAAVIAANKQTWYSIAPLYFIVRDAGHADPTIALNALREIARRESAAALSPSSARYVADALLKKLGRKTALSMIACDLLSDFETTDRLTDAQRREYFTRAVRINLVARSPVISGRSVPVKIEFQSDLPRGRYAFRGELGAFDLGESSRPSVMPHFSGEYVSGMRDHDAVLAAPPDPGTHIVTARLKFSIHRAKHSGSKRSSSPIPNEFGPAIFDAEPELTASVEVRDPDDENPVKKIHDPLLACEMTKAFRPSRLFVRKNPFAEGRHELSGYILIDAPPPAAVAFDVFVRVGEREFQAGNFTRGRGTSGLSEWGFMIDRWTHGTSQPVSVVFRANPQLVEETTDLFEVWVGELLYENVAVADTEPPREPPRLPKIPPGLPPEFRPPGSNP